MEVNDDWWPLSLRHLSEAYLNGVEEEVTIAEITSGVRNGYEGVVESYTALVPIDRLDEVLSSPGGIGHKVEGWGPMPSLGDDEPYVGDMWIQGPKGNDDKLDALVVGWDYHNKSVMIPDNGFLLAYGLCPRVLKNPDRIIWDDLNTPFYDVVSVQPLSHYEIPNSHSKAEVLVNKKYLQDYAGLKKCAVVSVYYEERYCKLDDEIEEFLDGEEAVEKKFPGRLLNISHNPYHKKTPYFCSVWGCRLILESTTFPVSNAIKPDLIWPGFDGVMSKELAMRKRPLDYVYVSDEVLDMFEGKPEYDINPNSGSVGYDGRWALTYSHRVGRDFIAYELKKIYEGCPASIIEYVHKYAVEPELAKHQRDTFGVMNIATRSEELINKFIEMGRLLALLGESLGFPFEDEDIVSHSRNNVEYYGWWKISDFEPLARRAPLIMTRDQFLGRCNVINKILEALKEKPLRRILEKLCVEDSDIKGFRTNRLLATVIRLCMISNDTGLNLQTQSSEVAERLDQDVQIESLDAFFGLVDLRNASGHRLGGQKERRIVEALEKFDIEPDELVDGWGNSLDQVYDKIIEALNEINDVFDKVLA